MAKKINAHCPKCNKNFEGKLSKNLAGFPRAKCPECGSKILYPLGKVYKTIYWIIIVLSVIELLYYLVMQQFEEIFEISIAGIALLVVSIYGLLKDRKIKKIRKQKI